VEPRSQKLEDRLIVSRGPTRQSWYFEVQYDSHGLACKPPYAEILEQACAVARVEFERMGSLLVKGEKTFEAVEKTIGGRWVWLFRMKKV
jgi:hypothetical protein